MLECSVACEYFSLATVSLDKTTIGRTFLRILNLFLTFGVSRTLHKNEPPFPLQLQNKVSNFKDWDI